MFILPSHGVVDFTCMAWNSLFKCIKIQRMQVFWREAEPDYLLRVKSICLETLIFDFCIIWETAINVFATHRLFTRAFHLLFCVSEVQNYDDCLLSNILFDKTAVTISSTMIVLPPSIYHVIRPSWRLENRAWSRTKHSVTTSFQPRYFSRTHRIYALTFDLKCPVVSISSIEIFSRIDFKVPMIHNSEEFKIQTILRIPKSLSMFSRRESSKSLFLLKITVTAHMVMRAVNQIKQKNNEPEVIVATNKNVLFWGSHSLLSLHWKNMNPIWCLARGKPIDLDENLKGAHTA